MMLACPLKRLTHSDSNTFIMLENIPAMLAKYFLYVPKARATPTL
jgi:hypothetical protein